jgi:hypothetical protein
MPSTASTSDPQNPGAVPRNAELRFGNNRRSPCRTSRATLALHKRPQTDAPDGNGHDGGDRYRVACPNTTQSPIHPAAKPTYMGFRRRACDTIIGKGLAAPAVEIA